MCERRRVSVVDLGTNSTRLLIADLAPDGTLEDLERRSTVTRLGEGVDTSGRLTDEAEDRVYACLGEYRGLADGYGVERSLAVATSAVRDAANGEEFQREVRERYGFEIRTLSGDEEARLTFLGATAGRDGADSTLVIDIGGGSTEYVVGHPGAVPDFHVSTRLGSVRQTERHLSGDPPAEEEVRALAEAAREIVSDCVPGQVREDVGAGIAVAGTATQLAAIAQKLEPYDPARVDGYRLGLGECERLLAMLADLPLEERRQVAGLHPDRAPTIVAGAVILVQSMRSFELDEVETSASDILQGTALDDAFPVR